MNRQIDNTSKRVSVAGKGAVAASVGLMVGVFAAPGWAAPRDAGQAEGREKREIGAHSLLLDVDEIAKAEAVRDYGDGPFDAGGVKFGSGASLGANGILLGGLTLGGLVNLARSRAGGDDRSTVGAAFRGGYLLSLGGPLTLWPNASIGYSKTTGPYRTAGDELQGPREYDEKVHSWSAAVEARLLAELADHVGLSAGVKYTHLIASAAALDDAPARDWYSGTQTVSADLGLAAWF